MGSWKDLPDVEQPKGSWKDLPDAVDGPPTETALADAANAPEESKPAGLGLEASDLLRINPMTAAPMAMKDVYDVAAGNNGARDKLKAAVNSATFGGAGWLAGKAASDDVKADFEKAERDYPIHGVAGAMLVPGPASIKALRELKGFGGAAARIGAGTAAGTGIGAATAATHGKDVGEGSLWGALGGFGGSVLGEGVQKIASFFGGKKSAAVADALAKGADDKADAIASAIGSKGGLTQKQHRQLQNMQDLLEFGSPEEQAEIKAFLASPEAAELRRKILTNSFEGAQGGMTALKGADEALDAARAIDETAFANETPWQTAKRAVVPRLEKLAVRGLSGAAGAVAGPQAAAAATLAAGQLGQPGTIVNNMVKDPNVRRHAFGALESLAETPASFASRATIPVAAYLSTEAEAAPLDGEEKPRSNWDKLKGYFGGGQ